MWWWLASDDEVAVIVKVASDASTAMLKKPAPFCVAFARNTSGVLLLYTWRGRGGEVIPIELRCGAVRGGE